MQGNTDSTGVTEKASLSSSQINPETNTGQNGANYERTKIYTYNIGNDCND
jgi:hypothetical protein